MPVRYEDDQPRGVRTGAVLPPAPPGRPWLRRLAFLGILAMLAAVSVLAVQARAQREAGRTDDSSSGRSAADRSGGAPGAAAPGVGSNGRGQVSAPAELPTGAAGEDVGATEAISGGIPVGFPQTVDGAASAAMTFTNAAGRALFLPADVRARVVNRIYTAEARRTTVLTDATAGKVQRQYQVTQDGLGRKADGSIDPALRARAECLFQYGAYRVDGTTTDADSAAAPTEVVVTTWAPCLVGVGSAEDGSKLHVRWSQATTTLVWSGSDWQVDATIYPTTTPPAPAEPRGINVGFEERARLLGPGWQMTVDATAAFDDSLGLRPLGTHAR